MARFSIAWLIIIGAAVVFPASAQTGYQSLPPAPPEGVITSPSLITNCLCSERRVATLRGRLREVQKQFDEERSRLDALDHQLEQSRSNIDVGDRDQLDAFRRLTVERERTHALLYNVDQPHYAEVVQSYNSEVGAYNGLCAGKSLDGQVVSQVRASLVCPRDSAP
jgi:hypothetical protein